MVEPFFLTMGQIADLTDDQLANVYFHPRDDEGRLDFSPVEEFADEGDEAEAEEERHPETPANAPQPVSFCQLFARVQRLRNPLLTDAEIEAKFKAQHPNHPFAL